MLEVENGDYIRSIESNDLYLAYGTQNGYVLLENSLTKKKYKYKIPTIAGSVERLFFLPNEQLLIAPSTGAYIADIKNNKLITLFNYGTIKDISWDSNFVFLALANALIKIKRVDKKHGLFSLYSNQKIFDIRSDISNQIIISNKRCLAIETKPHESISYCFFKDGLYSIDQIGIQPVFYFKKKIVGSTLLQFRDKIFIQTYNHGLLVLKKNKLSKVSYITQEWENNSLLYVKLIKETLFLVYPNSIHLVNATSENLLQIIPISSQQTGSIYDLSFTNKEIGLAAAKGFFSIRLPVIKSHIPKVYLLSVKSQKRDLTDLYYPNLDHNENTIEIVFSSPIFFDNKTIDFEYRLIGGYDSSWRKIKDQQRNINLLELASGRYIFEIRVNNLGVKQTSTKFLFSISKPFWEKGIFRIFIIFILVFLSFLVIKWQINSNNRKNMLLLEKSNLKHELIRSQLKAFQSQMNPHFIFNTLNIIQAFIYENDLSKAGIYLGKFSELVRNILKFSTQESISLKEEISLIKLYLEIEQARFNKMLKINFHIDSNIDVQVLRIPAMLIQPHIENAIKHGLMHLKSEKILSISIIKHSSTTVLIVIDDNGIGRSKSLELKKLRKIDSGFGLTAIKNRISLMNQIFDKKINYSIIDKVDDNGNSMGTTVKLFLPIHYE